jgi:transcriptional regulator with XRE-family HTH domain
MIGNNIQTIRKEKGLKLSQVAKACGISAGYLSDIEKGNKANPSIDVLNKIATVLNVGINSLLSTEEKLNMTMDSMKEIHKLAEEGLSSMIMENTESYNYSTCSFFVDQFKNEKFDKDEQNEIINYVKYIISKRK